MRKLVSSELFRKCEEKELGFFSTNELEPKSTIIGQPLGLEDLKFAVNLNMKNSHVYLCGDRGIGKSKYIKNYLQELSKNKQSALDICYVCNYLNINSPLLFLFPKGIGKEFKKDIEKLLDYILVDINNMFISSSFQNKKRNILKVFTKKRLGELEKINHISNNYGFSAKLTDGEIFLTPNSDIYELEDLDYDSLPLDKQKEIEENLFNLQKQIAKLIEKISSLDNMLEKDIYNLFTDNMSATIEKRTSILKDKYVSYEKSKKSEKNEKNEKNKIIGYLDSFKEDIINNIMFVFSDDNMNDFSYVISKFKDLYSNRYLVNLLVDQSNTVGCPVVIGSNLNVDNIMGNINIETYENQIFYDYMSIEAGLFHKANGGFLILNINEIFDNNSNFEIIKYILKNNTIDFSNFFNKCKQIGTMPLTPEPMPLNLKVIIIGSSENYEILRYYDYDFTNIIPMKIEFTNEIDYNNKNIIDLAKYIKSFIIEENLPELHVSAVSSIIDYTMTLAENKNKCTLDFNKINQLIRESVSWYYVDNDLDNDLENKKENNYKFLVTSKHIKKAIKHMNNRNNIYEKKISNMFMENIIIINTDGVTVGQINGISVISSNGSKFGCASRITATTYVGQKGLVNIEKEVNMSGEIHNKGVEIITGWLGQTYAQKFPLSLSCRVCFEQNYSGIDGDSASSTELYAILSSLSGVGIKQSLAVTGSINQKGEIQGVGGINHKIQGFFDLCQKKGINKEQGVIIPYSNISDLMLSDEICQAVQEGYFHIYAISYIDQGIELLMGRPAKEIHDLVEYKLKEFAKYSSN